MIAPKRKPGPRGCADPAEKNFMRTESNLARQVPSRKALLAAMLGDEGAAS